MRKLNKSELKRVYGAGHDRGNDKSQDDGGTSDSALGASNDGTGAITAGEDTPGNT